MTTPSEFAAVEAKPDGRRVVIVHYHLFKNAGTSIDRALKAQCGDRWASIEADHGDQKLSTSTVRALIDARPGLLAISSHTAPIEPHLLGNDVHVIPIVFLRHPVDRIRSAYDFERKQGADTLGSRMASTLTFPDYVNFFIQHPHSRSFRNFQSHRLSRASQFTEKKEIERALDALDQLAVVGVVERYDLSVRAYDRLIQAQLTDFELSLRHDNAGNRTSLSLDSRLKEIYEELGREMHEKVIQNNLLDLLLWKQAFRKLLSPAISQIVKPGPESNPTS